jgi:acyl-CoA thioester hydrolase
MATERGMTDSLSSTAPRASAHNDAMIRVRYAETDQMGVVYHANYLIWFEVGRVELMRALGVEYKSMEKDDDCHIVVVQANCRYLRPAKYDEELRVRTRIAGMRNRSISFAYEVFRDHDQTLLATGETVHVICGSNGKPKILPQKYRHILSGAPVAIKTAPPENHAKNHDGKNS